METAVARHRAAAGERRVTVHTPLDRAVRVRGHAARLTQVVDHLVDNALKFTPENGRVEVRLERRGGRAWIVAQDTGGASRPTGCPGS